MVVATESLEAKKTFERFSLDESYGFISNIDRSSRSLPSQYEAWELIAANLPALATSGKLYPTITMMPLLDVTPIIGDRLACERAHMLLSFITHCYVRGRLIDSPQKVIPECLAEPWIKVSEAIGTIPILTFGDTTFYNFRLLNPLEPLHLDNVWTIITASGSIDESWFYLISLAIEARSGELIKLYIRIALASKERDYETFETLLKSLSFEIESLEGILMRMYESNLPAVFYQRVRRYLGGWLNDDSLPEGILYGKEMIPRKYAGGSAAQSPTIQSLDIILGVKHLEKDHLLGGTGVPSAGAYILEMRKYMARDHREFLLWLEENINVHDMVTQPNVPLKVINAFNECLERLKTFRNKHLSMVSIYILVQAQKTEGKGETKGTGGSNPVPFLKEIKSHMDTTFVLSTPQTDQSS